MDWWSILTGMYVTVGAFSYLHLFYLVHIFLYNIYFIYEQTSYNKKETMTEADHKLPEEWTGGLL